MDRFREVRHENGKGLLREERGFYVGYFNDYPDYQTQATSKEGLIENLRDLLSDLQSGEIPYVRKVEELVWAE